MQEGKRGRRGRPAANNKSHSSSLSSYLDSPEDVFLHELLAEVLDVHLVVINGEVYACEPPCTNIIVRLTSEKRYSPASLPPSPPPSTRPYLGRPALHGLLADLVKVLLVLADIGTVADDVEPLCVAKVEEDW